jgi:uroporphyrin-3 C-methyltransferase
MVLQDMGRELLALVQISKVASPDVLLMTPDQRELVRQQLRMHILSARMSLVARQPEAVQQDLDQVRRLMNHHVSLNTPTAEAAKGQLTALEQSLKQLEWPELKDSLAALNQLQAGR